MIPRGRMVVAAAALIGVFVATYLLMYKLGMVGTLVCGAGGGCETVQASKFAYFLGIPVAAWGLAGYLAIFALAFAGTHPRFAHERWVSLGLLLLTGGAFLFSVYLSVLEEFVIRAWCRWCIASAVIATVAFLFALPEIRRLRQPREPA